MPDHRNDEQRRRLTEEYARKTDAANRVFTHAFLVGVVVNGWGFFAWVVYTMRLDIGPPKFLYAAILLWSSVFVGILGGIDLIVFTWLAMFVVPKRKSSAAA